MVTCNKLKANGKMEWIVTSRVELLEVKIRVRNLPLSLPISNRKFKGMALVDVYWENDKIFEDCFKYFIEELSIGGFFVGNVDYFNLLLQDLWICEIHATTWSTKSQVIILLSSFHSNQKLKHNLFKTLTLLFNPRST
jgi:hypothetical protein